MRIRDRIIREIRARGGSMDFLELVELICPSALAAHPTLVERRRLAVLKNVGRARQQLLSDGLTLVMLRADRKQLISIVELPQCHERRHA